MKRVFISQPMQGKTDEMIQHERNKAVEYIQRKYEEPIEVIDSFFQGAPHDASPVWFLGKSITLMSMAAMVVFLPGWEKARGCKIEHEVAVQYGIPTMELWGGE